MDRKTRKNQPQSLEIPQLSMDINSSPSTSRKPPKSLSFATSMSTPSPRGDRYHFLYAPTSPFPSLSHTQLDGCQSNITLQQNGVIQIPVESSNKDISTDDQKLKSISAKMEDLELVSDLGSGTCGNVVKMKHQQSGIMMAVKQMRRTHNEDENKRILMDLDTLLKCNDCPYIVKCLGFFINDLDVWICMELMNTSFDKIIKQEYVVSVPEFVCGRMAVDTLSALSYLKDVHGVIHRDVKPSNILINVKGVIKLCDFGISGRLVNSNAKTRGAGCAAYMAPERIDPPNPCQPVYDIRADVWSLGITLVELSTGKFPYAHCKTDFEILTRVLLEDPPVPQTRAGISPIFVSFLTTCLAKNYKDRPKYKRLMSHPFVELHKTINKRLNSKYSSIVTSDDPVAAWIQKIDSVSISETKGLKHPPRTDFSPVRLPTTTSKKLSTELYKNCSIMNSLGIDPTHTPSLTTLSYHSSPSQLITVNNATILSNDLSSEKRGLKSSSPNPNTSSMSVISPPPSSLFNLTSSASKSISDHETRQQKQNRDEIEMKLKLNFDQEYERLFKNNNSDENKLRNMNFSTDETETDNTKHSIREEMKVSTNDYYKYNHFSSSSLAPTSSTSHVASNKLSQMSNNHSSSHSTQRKEVHFQSPPVNRSPDIEDSYEANPFNHSSTSSTPNPPSFSRSTFTRSSLRGMNDKSVEMKNRVEDLKPSSTASLFSHFSPYLNRKQFDRNKMTEVENNTHDDDFHRYPLNSFDVESNKLENKTSSTSYDERFSSYLMSKHQQNITDNRDAGCLKSRFSSSARSYSGGDCTTNKGVLQFVPEKYRVRHNHHDEKSSVDKIVDSMYEDFQREKYEKSQTMSSY